MKVTKTVFQKYKNGMLKGFAAVFMEREIRIGLLMTGPVLLIYLPVFAINNLYLGIGLVLFVNFAVTVMIYKAVAAAFLKMKESLRKNNIRFVIYLLLFLAGIAAYLMVTVWLGWIFLNILHMKGLIYFKLLV